MATLETTALMYRNGKCVCPLLRRRRARTPSAESKTLDGSGVDALPTS